MTNCIFCQIIEGKIPSKAKYEDAHVLAFDDVNPQAPVHILIVPKQHIPSFLDIDDVLLGYIFKAINKLVDEYGLREEGFRLVNNFGTEGGQTVPHLHFHLLAGRSLSWPPG